MLGYHVHEKAILMAIIPAGMLAADSVADARVYLMMSIVGHVSLFPLLFEVRELPLKFILSMLHIMLAYVSLDRYHRGEQSAMRIRQKGIVFSTLETLYFAGLGALVVFVEFLHPILFRSADGTLKMPFLPLLLLSIYCTGGLAYAWLLSYQQFTSKVSRIMSYAESPFSHPVEASGRFAKIPSLNLNRIG
jgi:alpha-1,3-glucosyltransferase